MLFSDVLGSMTRAGDGWTVRIESDWLQGRSAFGGLQAAIALRAMRAIAPLHPLRVLQTTFIAPVPEGTARVSAQVLRSGKTTVHAEARIFDGESVAAVVIGIFGQSRPSEIRVVPPPPALEPGPSPIDLPTAGGFPAFLQHFQMRWLHGAPPGSGSPSPKAIVEVGLRDSALASEAHVVALADATPPVALSMLKARVPGSSLTWTLEMLQDGGDAGLAALPLSGWRLDVELVAGAGGYTSQSETVWGPGGEPVALSRQCMVVFG
jgi:hypothetical protein